MAARSLTPRARGANSLITRARAVKLALFDVDGVFTDGTVYFSSRGESLKAFNILDGHGIKMLRAGGIEPAILSGRRSGAVTQRARELGIRHVMLGVSDKRAEFQRLLARLKLAPEQASHMGDDLPDLPVMRQCGIALAPPNAHALILDHAHYVTQAWGGHGAVREACEWLLAAQGKLDGLLAEYLD
jgi:3-deoxy-D-manno-octulosonate 8-phosphate phosphatase (KDO 8-P phosphatase)